MDTDFLKKTHNNHIQAKMNVKNKTLDNIYTLTSNVSVPAWTLIADRCHRNQSRLRCQYWGQGWEWWLNQSRLRCQYWGHGWGWWLNQSRFRCQYWGQSWGWWLNQSRFRCHYWEAGLGVVTQPQQVEISVVGGRVGGGGSNRAG